MVTGVCSDHTGPSTAKKKRKDSTSSVGEVASEEDREKQLAESLHSLQRSQAVGESGIEALHAEGGVQELDNTIVGADATIKAWRFMQVKLCPITNASHTFSTERLWVCARQHHCGGRCHHQGLALHAGKVASVPKKEKVKYT